MLQRMLVELAPLPLMNTLGPLSARDGTRISPLICATSIIIKIIIILYKLNNYLYFVNIGEVIVVVVVVV